ncbi:MAG: WG repeat-containing protein [Clostridia bacterium]|nr:WG repeat-containing protein [Clostridia bacterium]
MKKIIIIIILLLIIGIGAIVTKTIFTKSKLAKQVEKITELNYFLIKENEKYGVINKNGDIIISPEYEEITIPNPEKDLFICENEEKSIILNSKKETLFNNYEEIEPIRIKNVANNFVYENNTLKNKEKDNNKYGLIDFSGKKITKCIYSEIENLSSVEGKFLVTENNKKGVIDLKGNTLVNIKYDDIISDGYYTKNDQYLKSGYIVSNKTDEGYRYGYINYDGKNILDTEYNEIYRIPQEDKNMYLVVSKNGKFGVYKNSKNIVKFEYNSITYDENSKLLNIEKNKKYGMMTLDGKTIIQIENDEIESRGIYIYAKKDNKETVYDKEGKIVDINFNKTIFETENENYKISTLLNNNIELFGVIDKEGNTLINEKYAYIEYLYQDFFIVANQEGALGIINQTGETVLQIKYASIQKIKGKNIVQAIDNNTQSEFYSKQMRKVAEMKSPIIQIQEDYIIVLTQEENKEEKIYLNNDGEILQNTKDLKNTSFPEKIGDYRKEQIGLETVYYIK